MKKNFAPGTVTLGAARMRDRIGLPLFDLRGRPVWQMPKPIRHEPHWMNPKKRAEAEAAGLDRMTAGVKYTILVPIYRWLPTSVVNYMKNKLRRQKMGRWSN